MNNEPRSTADKVRIIQTYDEADGFLARLAVLDEEGIEEADIRSWRAESGVVYALAQRARAELQTLRTDNTASRIRPAGRPSRRSRGRQGGNGRLRAADPGPTIYVTVTIRFS